MGLFTGLHTYLQQPKALSCVVLVFVCLICYVCTLWFSFTYDDNFAVINNNDVTSPAFDLRQLLTHDFWGQDIKSDQSHKSYRPLTVLLFRMERIIGDYMRRLAPTWFSSASSPHPAVFHAVSIILHTMVTLLLYRCVGVLGAVREDIRGWKDTTTTSSTTTTSTAPAQYGLGSGTGGDKEAAVSDFNAQESLSVQPGSNTSSRSQGNANTPHQHFRPRVCGSDQPQWSRVDVESLLAALLFAVHPVHTEAVAGVVGQAELLSAALCLSALMFYVHASRCSDLLLCCLWLLPCVLLVWAAAAAKEIGITVVGTMVLYDVLFAVPLAGCTHNTTHSSTEPLRPSATRQLHDAQPWSHVDDDKNENNTADSDDDVNDGGDDKNENNEATNSSMMGQKGNIDIANRMNARQDTHNWRLLFCVRLVVMAASLLLYVHTRRRVAGDHLVRIYRKVENPLPFISSPLSRMLTLGHLHSRYALLLWCPLHLSADWSFECLPLIDHPTDVRNLLSMLCYVWIMSSLVAAQPWQAVRQLLPARLRHTQRRLRPTQVDDRYDMLCLWGLMVAPFFPASNVLFYVGTFIGERLLYMPSAGFCMWVAAHCVHLVHPVVQQVQLSIMKPCGDDVTDAEKHTTTKERHSTSSPPGHNELQATYNSGSTPAAAASSLPPSAPFTYTHHQTAIHHQHNNEGKKEGKVTSTMAQEHNNDNDTTDDDKGQRKGNLSGCREGAGNAHGTAQARHFVDTSTQLAAPPHDSTPPRRRHHTGRTETHVPENGGTSRGNNTVPGFNLYFDFSMLCCAGLLVLLLWGIRKTVTRNFDWKDEEQLFQAALKVCPNSAKVQLNNGIIARRYQNWSGAEYHFRTASSIWPDYCETKYWLGITLVNSGQPSEGEQLLKQSVDCKYVSVDAVNALNTIYQSLYGSGAVHPAVLPVVVRDVLQFHAHQPLAACGALYHLALAPPHPLTTHDRHSQLNATDLLRYCTTLIQEHISNTPKSSSESAVLPLVLQCVEAQSVVVGDMQQYGLTHHGVVQRLYTYLNEWGAQCRTAGIQQGTAAATNTHVQLVHKFQGVNPYDPWLHREWCFILHTQQRNTEAAAHCEAAAMLVTQEVQLRIQQEKGAIFSFQSPPQLATVDELLLLASSSLNAVVSSPITLTQQCEAAMMLCKLYNILMAATPNHIAQYDASHMHKQWKQCMKSLVVKRCNNNTG